MHLEKSTLLVMNGHLYFVLFFPQNIFFLTMLINLFKKKKKHLYIIQHAIIRFLTLIFFMCNFTHHEITFGQ